jgi:hypothetical protein
MGHAMKKLLTISVAIMFAFGSVRAEDNFDIQIQLLDNEIERLTAEKQRQFSDLDRCASRVSGFRIAGISLLGLTAVGIGVNVYQRVQINRADFERCELERMRRPNPDTFKCDWDNSRNRWIIIDAPIVIEPVVTIPVLPTEVITETQETETTQVQTPQQPAVEEPASPIPPEQPTPQVQTPPVEQQPEPVTPPTRTDTNNWTGTSRIGDTIGENSQQRICERVLRNRHGFSDNLVIDCMFISGARSQFIMVANVADWNEMHSCTITVERDINPRSPNYGSATITAGTCRRLSKRYAPGQGGVRATGGARHLAFMMDESIMTNMCARVNGQMRDGLTPEEIERCS